MTEKAIARGYVVTEIALATAIAALLLFAPYLLAH